MEGVSLHHLFIHFTHSGLVGSLYTHRYWVDLLGVRVKTGLKKKTSFFSTGRSRKCRNSNLKILLEELRSFFKDNFDRFPVYMTFLSDFLFISHHIISTWLAAPVNAACQWWQMCEEGSVSHSAAPPCRRCRSSLWRWTFAPSVSV